MAAGHDQNLYEIFADTDSEYDEEFEGFDAVKAFQSSFYFSGNGLYTF